jgi:hypothetical protein
MNIREPHQTRLSVEPRILLKFINKKVLELRAAEPVNLILANSKYYLIQNKSQSMA